MEVREANPSRLCSFPQPTPCQPRFLTHGLWAFAVPVPARFPFGSHIPHLPCPCAHSFLSGASHSASARAGSRVCHGTTFLSEFWGPVHFQSLDIRSAEETSERHLAISTYPLGSASAPTRCVRIKRRNEGLHEPNQRVSEHSQMRVGAAASSRRARFTHKRTEKQVRVGLCWEMQNFQCETCAWPLMGPQKHKAAKAG